MTTVAGYHQAVKARLIADPLVLQFDIQRERRTDDDGYLRARLLLDNEEELEFSEYVRRVRDQVQVVTYSFHWTAPTGGLSVGGTMLLTIPIFRKPLTTSTTPRQCSSQRVHDNSGSARQDSRIRRIQRSLM